MILDNENIKYRVFFFFLILYYYIIYSFTLINKEKKKAPRDDQAKSSEHLLDTNHSAARWRNKYQWVIISRVSAIKEENILDWK